MEDNNFKIQEQNIDFLEEDFEKKLASQVQAAQKKTHKKNPKKNKNKKNSKALKIILPIAIVLVLLGGFVALSVIPAKKELNNFKSTAKTFLKSVEAKDSPKTKVAFDELYISTKKLNAHLNGPLFKIARIIPKVKEELNIANDLLGTAIEAEEKLLSPLVDTMQEYPLGELKIGDGFNAKLMSVYLNFIEENQDYIEELLTKINNIKPDSYVGKKIAKKKAKIDELSSSYREAIELLPLLKVIVGDGSDRLYILAAQNSAEIRASGGFPGSMGTIRIKDGILKVGGFHSVYDMLIDRVPRDAGIDYEDYIFGQKWLGLPWDACFIPEFSKAGRTWAVAYRDMRWYNRYEIREKEREEAAKREEAKAEALAKGEEYKEEEIESDCVPDEYFNDYDYYMKEFHVDGVISMTPVVIQMMLEDVGEIELSNGMKLDSTNATRILQYELYMEYYCKDNISYGSGWMADAMFSQTAKRAMKEFVGNFEISNFSSYYKLFKNGIDQHIINIWMEDPEEQKIVEEAGAAGQLCYDENDPFVGIYFSLATPCKLGWYLDMIPEISEPVDNPDGSKTYDVKVTYNNIMTEEEVENATWYIRGDYRGTICSYIHFVAPAGGTISNIFSDDYSRFSKSTYHGLDVAYMYDFLIAPQETITVTFEVTTAPGVETPLRAVTTPTLTDYRNQENERNSN